MSRDTFGERLGEQVEALNGRVLEAVASVVESDPDAVVVLMSDHGMRHDVAPVDEHYRSFLAARTPERPELFAEDESPVNLLRRVLSAYLGAAAEPLPYRAWTLDWSYNLRLEPFTPAEANVGRSTQ
jgi:hypothetical protein